MGKKLQIKLSVEAEKLKRKKLIGITHDVKITEPPRKSYTPNKVSAAYFAKWGE